MKCSLLNDVLLNEKCRWLKHSAISLGMRESARHDRLKNADATVHTGAMEASPVDGTARSWPPLPTPRLIHQQAHRAKGRTCAAVITPDKITMARRLLVAWTRSMSVPSALSAKVDDEIGEVVATRAACRNSSRRSAASCGEIAAV